MIPPRQRRAVDPVPVLPDGSAPPATRFPDETRPVRPHAHGPTDPVPPPYPTPPRQRRAVDGGPNDGEAG